MRLIFLNRFYWPDEPATAQLLTDLAEGLARRGHEVTVITSHPGRPGVPHREVRRGVRILRTRGLGLARFGLVGRAADFVLYLAGAAGALLFAASRDTWVVALTDPPLLGPVAWTVAGAAGAPVLHWTQDIYPEVAEAVAPGPLSRLAGLVLRPWRNLAWRRSRGVVALGREMAVLLRLQGVRHERIAVIPNWAPAGTDTPAPGEVAALRARWGVADRTVIAYSGNLGRVHDLEPVLDVAAELRDEPDFVFLFIGGGAHRAGLMRRAVQLELPNVHFLPAQPRSALAASLAAADLHLVTLRPGCEALVFPSKLYGIAAAGRPVVFIGPASCELAELVRSRGLGVARTREDTAGLAADLRRLRAEPAALAAAGRAAAAFSRDGGRVEHGLAAWESRLAQEAESPLNTAATGPAPAS
jgi:glycosyltransferase involved in cell wall biosynthesis